MASQGLWTNRYNTEYIMGFWSWRLVEHLDDNLSFWLSRVLGLDAQYMYISIIDGDGCGPILNIQSLGVFRIELLIRISFLRKRAIPSTCCLCKLTLLDVMANQPQL